MAAPPKPAVPKVESVTQPATGEPVAPSPSATEAWALPPSPEAQLLREAVRTLRIDRRPGPALNLLQEFQRSYPSSDLAVEARMLAAEAHLTLGNRRPALVELDAVAAKHGLPTELSLLRAELLADAHRCAEGLPVFNSLANRVLTEPQLERVLYGRAVCIAETEDPATARAAYFKYQQRFPHGRFAQSVLRALGGTTNAQTPP